MTTEATAGTARWIDDVSAPEWGESLERLPTELRDVYFQPGYVRLYEDAWHQAQCFVYCEGSSVYYYPFLVQQIPAHPGMFDITTAYGYGGPISTSSDVDFAGRAHAEFIAHARERGVIAELVKFHPLLENHHLAGKTSMRVVPVCPIVYVDLRQDEQHRWDHVYTHANRKNVNKAKRAGAVVDFDGGDDAWTSFERLYAKTMATNAATDFYHFSPAYFAGIRQRLGPHHRLVTVRLAGNVVAALIVLLGSRFAHCHLLGTDRAVMSVGVNNLLHHELILWTAAHGYERLLIGGGRGNDADDSLLRFKRNFSDTLATFFVGESIISHAGYQAVCDAWRSSNPERNMGNRLFGYRS